MTPYSSDGLQPTSDGLLQFIILFECKLVNFPKPVLNMFDLHIGNECKIHTFNSLRMPKPGVSGIAPSVLLKLSNTSPTGSKSPGSSPTCRTWALAARGRTATPSGPGLGRNAPGGSRRGAVFWHEQAEVRDQRSTNTAQSSRSCPCRQIELKTARQLAKEEGLQFATALGHRFQFFWSQGSTFLTCPVLPHPFTS